MKPIALTSKTKVNGTNPIPSKGLLKQKINKQNGNNKKK
jgi:hypothetical protein